MKRTGIIVEYNPFHNGHKYHIEQSRSLCDPDVLIACMSGNFNQRGDISIINKYEKTYAALSHGVDLVIELPYIYTVQNAYVFARSGVKLLQKLGIEELVFGSETGNLEELSKYADLEVDVTRLKELLHDGNSFPMSYGLLAGSLYPNDILAVAYLKALKDTSIKPLCIQRTNEYHSNNLDVIASATAIRNALQQGKDVSMATDISFDEPLFNKDLYPYIRRLLFTMSSEELRGIFLMSEGIENLLKRNAVRYDDYEDFLNASISRRYTRSRIQRILLHLCCHVRTKDVADLKEPDYIRVLGFNVKGRALLKEVREDVNIVTLFKNIPEPYKSIEYRSDLLYASLLKDSNAYIKRQLEGPVICK
ncbi:MAG: nucleotidyltransferase family protein [Erysipelotrichaceae bacterium]|nr:nucleotidyltransferase family protein [Erysipelotrichaceae bacterium]